MGKEERVEEIGSEMERETKIEKEREREREIGERKDGESLLNMHVEK